MILKIKDFNKFEDKLCRNDFYKKNKYLNSRMYSVNTNISPRKGGPYTYIRRSQYNIETFTANLTITTDLIRIYTWEHIII